MKRKMFVVVVSTVLLACFSYIHREGSITSLIFTDAGQSEGSYTLVVPSERFPETAAHIQSAISHGESSVCTIDRNGSEENRKESLKGVPTKPNLDRDEFPMAMCAEGGSGADIAYVKPSDNRGAGSWISHQLEKYPDGTRVNIVVK